MFTTTTKSFAVTFSTSAGLELFLRRPLPGDGALDRVQIPPPVVPAEEDVAEERRERRIAPGEVEPGPRVERPSELLGGGGLGQLHRDRTYHSRDIPERFPPIVDRPPPRAYLRSWTIATR